MIIPGYSAVTVTAIDTASGSRAHLLPRPIPLPPGVYRLAELMEMTGWHDSDTVQRAPAGKPQKI